VVYRFNHPQPQPHRRFVVVYRFTQQPHRTRGRIRSIRS
jgi:hypothetical protein